MKTTLLLVCMTLTSQVFAAKFAKVERFQSGYLAAIERSQAKITKTLHNDGYYPTKAKAKIVSRKVGERITDSLKQLIFIVNRGYSAPEFFTVDYLQKDFNVIPEQLYSLYENFYFRSDACKHCELVEFASSVSALLSYKNLQVFKLYHGNSFGESNEYAVIDYNTAEILIFGHSYAE